ncbi:hypothetical protein CALCODRAFT_503535 [Calocera cornea HHB12733]|uniref:Uncharacterized protein n=1 Tax=Calocera cornea HHB12733 TaxID=1353952 RepID=A0A165CUG8_9BASI|nr:hypothetical protein CALCODRAFT_503535 [Calocera cornea HHB12733]
MNSQGNLISALLWCPWSTTKLPSLLCDQGRGEVTYLDLDQMPAPRITARITARRSTVTTVEPVLFSHVLTLLSTILLVSRASVQMTSSILRPRLWSQLTWPERGMAANVLRQQYRSHYHSCHRLDSRRAVQHFNRPDNTVLCVQTAAEGLGCLDGALRADGPPERPWTRFTISGKHVVLIRPGEGARESVEFSALDRPISSHAMAHYWDCLYPSESYARCTRGYPPLDGSQLP